MASFNNPIHKQIYTKLECVQQHFGIQISLQIKINFNLTVR
jgi:hypothetical protein